MNFVSPGEGDVFPCDRRRKMVVQPGGDPLAGPRQADTRRRGQDYGQGAQLLLTRVQDLKSQTQV